MNIGYFSEGSPEKQKKKKIIFIAAFVTAALLVLCLIGLAVFGIIHAVKGNGDVPSVPESGGDDIGGSMTTVTKTAADIKRGALLLVNSEANNEFDFEKNDETSLVKLSENCPVDDGGHYLYYQLANTNLRADTEALTAFNAMMEALSENVSDAHVVVTGAYRSAADQAGKSVAVGHSDFHTGRLFELKDNEGGTYTELNKKLAADGETRKYEWLYKNCQKYGFIVRYPEAKKDITGVSDFEYAFRYVGVAHASYIMAQGISLEEYVKTLKEKYVGYENALSVKAADGKSYRVFYAAAGAGETEISVPEKFDCTVSGNNSDGYIVTVSSVKKK